MKTSRWLLPLLLCLAALLPAPEVGAKETILVIESYHANYPWDQSYSEGLRETLGSRYDLVFFEMDTKRLPKEQHEGMAQKAWEKIKATQPALVVLGDDSALKFLGPRLAGSDLPTVYLGINNDPKEYKMTGLPNVTGVLERPLMKPAIGHLKSIVKPTPRKLLVLFDNSITSQASVAEIFKGKTTSEIEGIQVDLKLIGNIDEWKEAVLKADKNGYDALVVGLYHTIFDQYNLYVDSDDLLEWTVFSSPVPPFGFWDFTVGPRRTVGGLVLYGKVQGKLAGQLALQILGGKKAGEIPPVVAEEGQFLFSRSQLTFWNISLPSAIASQAQFTD
jgi:ABC-type uncharacterized transport system substrate-binding protein